MTRWAQQQRLDFIAQRLETFGRVNRRDIMAAFDISKPQASADLRSFQTTVAPALIAYDPKRKCYVKVSPGSPLPRPTPAAMPPIANQLAELERRKATCWQMLEVFLQNRDAHGCHDMGVEIQALDRALLELNRAALAAPGIPLEGAVFYRDPRFEVKTEGPPP